MQPNIDCYDKFAAGTEQMQERLLLSMIEAAPAGSDFIVLPDTVIVLNVIPSGPVSYTHLSFGLVKTPP